MANIDQYFPVGIVTGEAFIGRKEEAAWLSQNINGHVHTLIIAPRRYGKSSLAIQTLQKLKHPFVEIDLQLCRSTKTLEQKILKAVEALLTEISPEKHKLISKIEKYFKKSKKRWDIGLKGLAHVTIEPQTQDSPADNIVTALQLLDEIANQENKTCILFIDEVQEIIELDDGLLIQGALRHFAQKSQQVRFIFSGSNRRLLQHMFDDSKMPLYQLCDKITLNRIEHKDYEKYLQKVAGKTFGNKLEKTVIDELLQLTERHPRRTYNLCLYFWRLCAMKNRKPTIAALQSAWEKLIEVELKGIRSYLSKLTTAQLKIMAYIASCSGKELRGQVAIRTIGISGTAISKALQSLENNDLVAQDANGLFFIIDPTHKWVLKKEEALLY